MARRAGAQDRDSGHVHHHRALWRALGDEHAARLRGVRHRYQSRGHRGVSHARADDEGGGEQGTDAARPRRVGAERDLRDAGFRPAHASAYVSYSYRYQHHTEEYPTAAYPPVQQFGIRFFRNVYRTGRNLFAEIGSRGFFMRDTLRGFGEPQTFVAETIRQMRVIGVDSVPLAVLVAAFIGGVIALQTRYQLFAGVELSVVGLATRQNIILEMGPLLTGLVLAGRVGARMTAEIGTMRVTEQIDALETLAYDPLAYLVVPRVIAGLTMVPLLTILAIAIGILAGLFAAVAATDIRVSDYTDGLHFGVVAH